MSERMRELAIAIAAAKREITRIKRTFKLDKIEKELKELVLENVEPNEEAQRVIEFLDGNVRVVVFPRAFETADKKKAKELLKSPTYRAIFKSRESDVLRVKEITG